MKNKFLPQVKDGNNVKYWTEEFPKTYKNRNITELDSYESETGYTVIADGDVVFTINKLGKKPKKQLYCTCCNQYVNKWYSRFAGNKEVGFEVVFYCGNCNEGKYRLYTKL